MYYYEHCLTTSNRIGRMLTKEQLIGKTGFVGLYGFDELTAAFFREAGTTKGAKNFAVYSDELWMDIDDNPVESERIVNMLVDMGIGVQVFNTGGRGHHVGIKHQPIFDRNLPYSQKMWIKNMGLNVDFCLYTHGHIFRLEGTRHHRTGGYKALEFSFDGSPIVLPILAEPIRERKCVDGDGDFDLKEFSNLLQWFTQKPPKNGERNHKLYALSAGLLSVGLSSEATVELVEKFNLSIDEPLEEDELSLLLESACGSVGG